MREDEILYAKRCVHLTVQGSQCKRDPVWFHHWFGWCAQHAPNYLKEAYGCGSHLR